MEKFTLAKLPRTKGERLMRKKKTPRERHMVLMAKKARHERTKKHKDPNTQSPSMAAYKSRKIDQGPPGGILAPILPIFMGRRRKPKPRENDNV